MAKKRATALHRPELYIGRELSWLEFNRRVLDQGLALDDPPLERLRFLAIVSSNLDEFYMIRVAGLMQQRAAGLRRRDASGMTPTQQLAAISERAHQMVAEQQSAIRALLSELTRSGVRVSGLSDLSAEQLGFARGFFAREVLPVLTPLALESLKPPPLLMGLRLHVAALLERADASGAPPTVVVLQVPTHLPRFVPLPSVEVFHAVRLEELIMRQLDGVFPQARLLAACAFRITRDGDVPLHEDEAGDLLHAVEEAVIARRRRAAVRLEIAADADERLRSWLMAHLGLHEPEVFDIDGLLDAASLHEIVGREGLQQLRAPEWVPQPALGLDQNDLWTAIADGDRLLIHPYESFEPVVGLVRQAATDPNVVAIKQVLYRTGNDSPFVAALAEAANRGKQVTVLVELKARFDEARNVDWARRLEDAGCQVVYGIAGLKTHAKALLILRREGARLRRYVHLSTGNYNHRTARQYADIGLLTSEPLLAADVAAFFNLLTGTSDPPEWLRLTIAPTGLRARFLELIEREISLSTLAQPGFIRAKMNSLQDEEICRALYRASQAGVQIHLNVRGICCLRPGVPGVSETIEVRSLIDRFLEHARIYGFRNGGHEQVFLSSADWMTRNLDHRLELLFPVVDEEARRRLWRVLELMMTDNTHAYVLRPGGRYERVPAGRPRVRAQEELYADAVRRAQERALAPERFRPLTAPADGE